MIAHAPLPATLRHRSALLHILLIVGFVLLVLWFKIAAPYDNYFFNSSRQERVLHILARIAFTAYLFGIFFGAGQWLLRVLTSRTGLFSLTACEEIAVSVLAGSALVRVCMFCLGFANLYCFWLLMPLAALALAGAGRLPQLLHLPQLPGHARLTTRIARILLLTLLVAAVATVLAGKLVYPNGTGDYFTHYYHYYLHVIKSAGIWPNDVWYHFYISKGAGDVFLAMILSDPLAPLAVSFVMYLTGIAIGYVFLKRMTGNVLASLLVSVMIASAFIWTHNIHPLFTLWAEFSKQHVVTSALFFGVVWATWLLEELPEKERSAWRNITAAIIIGLIVLRTQFAALCGLYFILLAVVAACRRSPLIRTYILLAIVAGTTAVLMLAINYAVTGVAEVTPFRLFWKFADQEHFSHWVSPFLMLTLALGSSPEMGALTTPDFGHYHRNSLLALILRLDLVVPYIVPLLLCAALREPAVWLKSCHRSLTPPPALPRGLTCLAAMLLAAAITIFCNNQIVSTFRLYMFCLYPVLMLTAIPFAVTQQVYVGKPKLEKVTAVGLVLVGLLAFSHAMHLAHYKQKWVWSTASLRTMTTYLSKAYINQPKKEWINFALGTSTIAQAYAEQEQGFLWKPGIAACSHVPPDTRIWSSQITGELFESPHCRFETFFSYSMGRDYAVILFEDADKAEAALRQQKLDYFLIDTTSPFFDILPYAPLFSPKQISRHFGVAWSQGGVYLLTWRSPQTPPLPPEFFVGYRKSIKSALNWADFPAIHQALSRYYFDWKRNPHWPVAVDPNAPHPRGWQ